MVLGFAGQPSVLSGPHPRSELPEHVARLFGDLPTRGLLVRFAVIEPAPRCRPPALPAVLEPREKYPAGLVEEYHPGGMSNGWRGLCHREPSLHDADFREPRRPEARGTALPRIRVNTVG
jgi:hypothetical protein